MSKPTQAQFDEAASYIRRILGLGERAVIGPMPITPEQSAAVAAKLDAATAAEPRRAASAWPALLTVKP